MGCTCIREGVGPEELPLFNSTFDTKLPVKNPAIVLKALCKGYLVRKGT